jgi:hypothetical protein
MAAAFMVVLNVPAKHAMQSPELFEPLFGLYLPSKHCAHDFAAVSPYAVP